jgi:hypothetical protein
VTEHQWKFQWSVINDVLMFSTRKKSLCTLIESLFFHFLYHLPQSKEQFSVDCLSVCPSVVRDNYSWCKFIQNLHEWSVLRLHVNIDGIFRFNDFWQRYGPLKLHASRFMLIFVKILEMYLKVKYCERNK